MVSSISARICFTRAVMSAFLPLPSTMVQDSLSMTMRLAWPRSLTVAPSSFTPMSSEMQVPPVRTAMS